MESVTKANKRLKNYPILIGKCASTATIYAKCVTRDLNVAHKACDKEFQDFKNCLINEAKKMNTKL